MTVRLALSSRGYAASVAMTLPAPRCAPGIGSKAYRQTKLKLGGSQQRQYNCFLSRKAHRIGGIPKLDSFQDEPAEKGAGDGGMDVRFATDGWRVSQRCGDLFHRSAHRALGLRRARDGRPSREKSRHQDCPSPSAKILGGDVAAGDL